ncbi:MAG TPA: metallophosphoesterase, partial [Myxococcota bacterium]|nr:metallophosphoesterase [Myxococcota bacterium]
HIWGSPWQPRFFDWAFNLDRGEPLRRVWQKIPDGIDILVTHGPPKGILDRVQRGGEVGCEELREALRRVRPRLHVFGHIHEAYGQLHLDGTHFVNAASCNLDYRPVNPPVVVEL